MRNGGHDEVQNACRIGDGCKECRKAVLNERRNVNNRAATVTLLPVALPFA